MSTPGRIKRGVLCMQDHHVFRWPLPGVDPDMRFVLTAEESGRVEARADGFGLLRPEKYGNGSITLIPVPTRLP